jgi:HEAT repeat protein
LLAVCQASGAAQRKVKELMTTTEKVRQLILELQKKNGVERERARKELVKIGKPAVGPLVKLLNHKSQHLRWEACKALGSIRDPSSAASLVEALCDDSIEIQWLAAEALTSLGTKSLVPLLGALETRFDSVLLRQGARRVLNALRREGLLNGKTQAVLTSMRSLFPQVPLGLAAYEALMSLSRSKAK